MPQEVSQTATDPKTNPIAFVYENKQALANMPEDKAIKFVDVLFKRHVLPRYRQVNPQGLTPEKEQSLRVSFMARMFGIPGSEQTPDMGDPAKPGKVMKGVAAVEGAGAGVLGGIRTMGELLEKLSGGKSRDVKKIGELEGKAFDDASAIDPKIASGAAAVGHQIPAAIAAEGAGGLVPKLAAGAPAALKIAAGGAKGAVEGAAYETARPGGDPASGAQWGGVLGAAFPALGKVLGLGRGTAAPAKEAVSAAGSSTGAASLKVPAGTMKDLPNIVAQKAFGKAFKDLSSAERAQMPEKLKAEISSIRTAEKEGKKAASEAMKAVKEADLEKKRGEKAAKATETATKQAAKRSEGVPKATAQAAVAQNPQVTKAAATFQPEVRPGHETLKVMKENPGMGYGEASKIAEAKKGEPTVTKVPEGQRGTQKAGSPAKQAADRERIAKKRELAASEQINQSLEQHAREIAGRHTPASLNLMHLPEMEEAIKELPGGKEVLDGARKARKTYKMSDDIYMETLKEWMMDQFEKPQ